MEQIVKFILDVFQGYVGVLDGIVFNSFFGFTVSYFDLIIAFICVAMVVTIFWRGAKG